MLGLLMLFSGDYIINMCGMLPQEAEELVGIMGLTSFQTQNSVQCHKIDMKYTGIMDCFTTTTENMDSN